MPIRTSEIRNSVSYLTGVYIMAIPPPGETFVYVGKQGRILRATHTKKQKSKQKQGRISRTTHKRAKSIYKNR